MTDTVFRWLTLVIQGSGLVLLVFYGGKFIGEIKQIIKQVLIDIAILQSTIKDHAKEDSSSFEELNKDITEIKINMAKRH
jgi:hypothetical protein